MNIEGNSRFQIHDFTRLFDPVDNVLTELVIGGISFQGFIPLSVEIYLVPNCAKCRDLAAWMLWILVFAVKLRQYFILNAENA